MGSRAPVKELFAAFALFVATQREITAAERLVDVTTERGLTFQSVNGAQGKRQLVETMVAGVAWLDYDDDGYMDLYFVQAHHEPRAALLRPGAPNQPGNVLYRNVAGKRFEDVTRDTGVGDRGYGMGVAVGDYDGDGRQDLFVANYGRDTLYRNVNGEHFEDVTKTAGVGDTGWSISATFADYDADGRLDLYVLRYLDYDTRKDGACPTLAPGGQTVETYCNPKYFSGLVDKLYRNVGGGRFEDVGLEGGIISQGIRAAKGLGVLASDFDGDRDLDFFVANDTVNNNLWRNNGQGQFEDVALEVGFALNGEGSPEGSMGLCRGDVNGDGTLDYFVTNFSRETNTLYLNQDGYLDDTTIEVGMARAGYLPLGFGTVFFDFDLDGDLDTYVVNGHVLDNAQTLEPGQGIGYGQPDLLFENRGGGRFRDISASSGTWFQTATVGRSAALADFDNDGDGDLAISNVAAGAILLENRASSDKTWIGIDLRGRAGQPTHNARVELWSRGPRPKRLATHEVQTDGSYASAHDPRVVFALPVGSETVEVRVRWHGREEDQVCRDLRPSRYNRVEAD